MKSEISNVERNCMKYFNANAGNNNINVSNITNASNNTNVNTTNDDTYGGKIRDKKGDIRMILSRMGDIVPKNDRENSMKLKIRKTFQIRKKKRLIIILLN